MILLQRLTVLSLGFVALFHGNIVAAADVTDFVDFSFEDLPGRLYIPPEAQDSATPRPSFSIFMARAKRVLTISVKLAPT